MADSLHLYNGIGKYTAYTCTWFLYVPKMFDKPPKKIYRTKKNSWWIFQRNSHHGNPFCQSNGSWSTRPGCCPTPFQAWQGRQVRPRRCSTRASWSEKKMSTWTRLKWTMLDKYGLIIYVLIYIDICIHTYVWVNLSLFMNDPRFVIKYDQMIPQMTLGDTIYSFEFRFFIFSHLMMTDCANKTKHTNYRTLWDV